MEKEFRSSQELYYDFASFCDDWEFIFDDFVNETLQRYKLLKEHNISSYSQLYDDLPYKWVDTLSLLDSTVNEAVDAKRKHEEWKRGG